MLLLRPGAARESGHIDDSCITSLSANSHLHEKPAVQGLAETKHKPSPQGQPQAPVGSHWEEWCAATDSKLPRPRIFLVLIQWQHTQIQWRGMSGGGKVKKIKCQASINSLDSVLRSNTCMKTNSFPCGKVNYTCTS